MSEYYRKAKVFVQDTLAGVLSETEDGYCFEYLDDYYLSAKALPVSLTLPLTNERYDSNVLFSFFDGLIPEGWMIQLVSKNWKVNLNDRFGLLLVSCKDCIGDVSIEEVKDE